VCRDGDAKKVKVFLSRFDFTLEKNEACMNHGNHAIQSLKLNLT
jgi:hypothetical protein